MVSNATHPEVLADQPTQLYLSLNAPDEEHVPARMPSRLGSFWPKVLESLEIIKQHRCRSVIRMTLARGLNMDGRRTTLASSRRAEPDFVEVKAYMHLGRSRDRLTREAMPQHSEILDYSLAL